LIPLPKSKQQLLFILFGVAVLLIAANISLKYFQNGSAFPENFDSQSNYVNEKFLSAVKGFGLEDKWIKKSVQADENKDAEFSAYKISVPADLAIPEILKDVFTIFRKDSIDIESVEKKAGGKSILTLSMNEQLFLRAEFDYAKNFFRNKGIVAFILNDIEMDNLEDSLLIESPEKFGLLLTPSAENLKYLLYIKENRKEILVLFNDEIADQKYRLSSSYSDDRIKKALRSIVADYSAASFFVFDDASELYKSAKAVIIKDELDKRKISLHLLSEFRDLNDDEITIEEKFSEEMKTLERGSIKIFLIDKDTYQNLLPDIVLFKKAGVKVVKSNY
jgi:hypothetical protein